MILSKNLKSLIEKKINTFQNIKIAVFGDLILDKYLNGNAYKISPEAPVPVVKIEGEKSVLGGAANVINNLSALGSKTICFGIIGEDKDGDALLDSFSELVDTKNILRLKKRATTVKTRVMSGNHQLLRLDWEETNPISSDIEEIIIDKFTKITNGIDGVILSDYNKGLLSPSLSKSIIKISKSLNIPVFVDPKPENIANYYGVSCITPNKKEAFKCLNLLVNDIETVEKVETVKTVKKNDIINDAKESQITKVGKALRKKFGIETVLITRSHEGMSIFSDEIHNIPTHAKEVYDVTGAGDTVISIFALAKLSGSSWYEAAELANIAAGIVVAKLGTASVSKEELIKEYLKTKQS